MSGGQNNEQLGRTNKNHGKNKEGPCKNYIKANYWYLLI